MADSKSTEGPRKIRPLTTHPLVGRTCVFAEGRYPHFPHNGQKVIAAEHRGASVFAVFEGDPGIWIVHETDLHVP